MSLRPQAGNRAERTAWLPSFLAYGNTRWPHSALGQKP